MIRVLGALLATILGIVLAVPVVAQPADDDTARLLDLRRATQEELAEIGRQLDEIQVRKAKEDWVIVRAEDGEYVQVNLQQIDKLVPWVQMALADQDAAPVLLRALSRHKPDLVKAAETAELVSGLSPYLSVASEYFAGAELDAYRKLKAGDIESVDSNVIRAFIRDFFAKASERQRKADRYAAFEAQLSEQQETLQLLLAVLDAELEAREAASSDEPSECAEADMWCDDSTDDGSIEHDAFKGLTHCDDGDETCDDENLPPTEVEVWTEEVANDGDDSLAGCWKGSFGPAQAWVQLEQHGDGFEGEFVTRWQFVGDSGPSYAIDWVEGDLRSGWPRGTFYGTGPLDAWYTCEEPNGDHDHWATFDHWEADDRPFVHLCGDPYLTLTDRHGNDQSDPRFWVDPVADEVCDEAYSEASEYLGRSTDPEPAVSGASGGEWMTIVGGLSLRGESGSVEGVFAEDPTWVSGQTTLRLQEQGGDLVGWWYSDDGSACDQPRDGAPTWGPFRFEPRADGDGRMYDGYYSWCDSTQEHHVLARRLGRDQ